MRWYRGAAAPKPRLPKGPPKRLPDGSIELSDPSLVTMDQWDRMAAAMRDMDYDWPNGEYARAAIGRLTRRTAWDGRVIGDHAQALAEALGLVKASKPTYHEYGANVFEKAKKQFGVTWNFRLAGWLLPDGSLLDFSGGGRTRVLDHRDIGQVAGEGGTKGMQEFMAAGAIRLMPETGGMDISRMPTPAQMSRIAEIAKQLSGEVILDLEEGLGELNPASEYYRAPGHALQKEYPLGTNPSQVLSDIRGFFGAG